MHTKIVGFYGVCDNPKAKKAADLTSTILKQLKLLLEANPIAKGTFLEPGEITILKKLKFKQDKISD